MNVISVGGLVAGGELGGKLVAGGAAGYFDVSFRKGQFEIASFVLRKPLPKSRPNHTHMHASQNVKMPAVTKILRRSTYAQSQHKMGVELLSQKHTHLRELKQLTKM